MGMDTACLNWVLALSGKTLPALRAMLLEWHLISASIAEALSDTSHGARARAQQRVLKRPST